jgi:biopolymer transport protein ExbD
MLVLLIIFMVTAPIPTVDVRVDLPPPNPIQKPPDPLRRPTLVEMNDTSGQLLIYVDRQPTTLEGLGDKVLERAIENNPALSIVDMYTEAKIFLRADQESAYGSVIRVMSRLQEEGFVQVGIVAESAAF